MKKKYLPKTFIFICQNIHDNETHTFNEYYTKYVSILSWFTVYTTASLKLDYKLLRDNNLWPSVKNSAACEQREQI